MTAKQISANAGRTTLPVTHEVVGSNPTVQPNFFMLNVAQLVEREKNVFSILSPI